jgi:LytS/YehU family sensor histidine kinase
MFRQLVEVVNLTRIPLRRELEFVEAYLSLERARFGSRLQVAFDVPDELEDRLIPPLSLQVLVENAVKHGVAALEQGGEVAISVRDRAGALELQVADPGPGFARSQAHPTGTGTALDTLRLRLQGAGDVSFERAEGRHIARLVLYAGRTQTG